MKTSLKIIQLDLILIVCLIICGLCPLKDEGGLNQNSKNFSFIKNTTIKTSNATTLSTEKDLDSTSSFSPIFLKHVQRIVDNYRKNTETPGIAVAIYNNGKSCFLFSGNDGGRDFKPLTLSTAFAMGSVEKVFTSTLLAMAVAQGKVNIDDPAAKFIVAGDGSRVKPRAAFWKISLRDLVTHTSALPRKPPHSSYRIGTDLFNDRPLSPAIVQFLNSWRPKYPPSTKYKYSNLGFVLAGHVAVYIEKEFYDKLLTDSLTGPIGMTRTGMICQSPGPGCAMARDEKGKLVNQRPVGLWTCVKDMLRFIEANLGVLNLPTTLKQAIKITHRELFRMDEEHAIGMGWEEWHHGDALLLSKDGLDSGFSSWVGFEPHKKCGVVVLRNGGKKPGPVELGRKLMAALHQNSNRHD